MIDDSSENLENSKWSAASLCIFSRSMTAAQITGLMETEPSRSHNEGDLVSLRNPTGPRRKENGWFLRSEIAASELLDVHILDLVCFLEEHTEAIEQLRSACEISLFCTFASRNGQGGFTLEPELLKRLAMLNITLTVDLYPPARDGCQE